GLLLLIMVRLLFLFFFSYPPCDRHLLHSFPTRRSSDLMLPAETLPSRSYRLRGEPLNSGASLCGLFVCFRHRCAYHYLNHLPFLEGAAMTAIESAAAAPDQISEREYKRRVRAWTLYDWANSAFATTILAAVLPVYYSQVAGATLPSEAAATGLWSLGLSISLLLVAIL